MASVLQGLGFRVLDLRLGLYRDWGLVFWL